MLCNQTAAARPTRGWRPRVVARVVRAEPCIECAPNARSRTHGLVEFDSDAQAVDHQTEAVEPGRDAAFGAIVAIAGQAVHATLEATRPFALFGSPLVIGWEECRTWCGVPRQAQNLDWLGV